VFFFLFVNVFFLFGKKKEKVVPRGVPVATVGLDNGENAGHLALRILGK
jgi:hypothetical protein